MKRPGLLAAPADLRADSTETRVHEVDDAL
jgi:hypothetical protein